MDNEWRSYFTVEPSYKFVTEQEFNEFVANYPRNLTVSAMTIVEPPVWLYVDYELADVGPYNEVAARQEYSNDPTHRYYTPEAERKFKILENYREVFDSRTRNKCSSENNPHNCSNVSKNTDTKKRKNGWRSAPEFNPYYKPLNSEGIKPWRPLN